MATYKLESVLWCIGPKDFDNDHDAWETLRKSALHKFMTLFRLEEVKTPILNPDRYVQEYNKKYNETIEAENLCVHTYWLPVLIGITDDEYDENNLLKV